MITRGIISKNGSHKYTLRFHPTVNIYLGSEYCNHTGGYYRITRIEILNVPYYLVGLMYGYLTFVPRSTRTQEVSMYKKFTLGGSYLL